LSFTPYLQKFGARLGHQYKLTFLAYAEEKDTTQHIRIETEVPGVELEGPPRVRIPGVRREDIGD
jgi:HSP20 family molecular chaperone IbpA